MDNGFCRFNNIRVKKDALLNKHFNVDSEGNYTSTISSKSRRFGFIM